VTLFGSGAIGTTNAGTYAVSGTCSENGRLVTIGGSVSISGIVPGGGTWPIGTLVRIQGSGFGPGSKLLTNVKYSFISIQPNEIQMVLKDGHMMGEGEPSAIRFARRFVHVSTDFDSERFRVRHGSKLMWTPLFLAIVVIGIIDLVFAVDSIPSIFGITKDPFVVFTANAFAILGLRSLYFLLADAKDRFHYLPKGLGFVLIFIGAKMAVPIVHALVPEVDVHIDPLVSLLVVVGILGGFILLSLLRPVALRKGR
jgi:TerC family integral membrane protein